MFDPISAAIGIGSLVGGGLSLWGSSMQANASQNAANTEASTQQQIAQMQQNMYNQTRSDLSPYRQSGSQALGKLSQMSPFSFQFNQSDPSYQFRMQQGLAGVNASAAARGGYFSGATGQALTNYGQGLASEEYGNEYNRALQTYQTNFNDLYNVANMGENAAAQTGQMGQQAMNSMGNAMGNAASAQAGGMTGAANAWAGGLQGVNNNLMSGIGNFAQYQMMQQMYPQQKWQTEYGPVNSTDY